jgi:hypothetical protein
MLSRSTSLATWKAVAILGMGLIAMGILAGYLDVATHFRFEFISDDFDSFILAMAIGVILSFIGLIGWAAQPGTQRRGLMAGLVFIAPWIVLLLGWPIGGNNIHGPAALVMLLILPASILAFVLAIMAAAKRNA